MSLSHQANPNASQATSGSAKDDGIVVRPFRMEDYDEVFALWRRSEGVGLGASDTRAAIAAYVRRNPGLSFVAHRKGRLVGTVLCGHDGRRGYLASSNASYLARVDGYPGNLDSAALDLGDEEHHVADRPCQPQHFHAEKVACRERVG